MNDAIQELANYALIGLVGLIVALPFSVKADRYLHHAELNLHAMQGHLDRNLYILERTDPATPGYEQAVEAASGQIADFAALRASLTEWTPQGAALTAGPVIEYREVEVPVVRTVETVREVPTGIDPADHAEIVEHRDRLQADYAALQEAAARFRDEWTERYNHMLAVSSRNVKVLQGQLRMAGERMRNYRAQVGRTCLIR